MTADISLQVAQDSLQSWAEHVVAESHAAEDCGNCDDHLRNGIKAFQFISHYELVVREASLRGLQPWTEERDRLIGVMYRSWAHTADLAGEWIGRIQTNAYHLDNLDEFRECKDKVEDWIESKAWTDLSQTSMGRILNADTDPQKWTFGIP